MAFRPVRHPNDPQWRTVTGNPAGPEMQASFLNPNKGIVCRPSDGHAIPIVGWAIRSDEEFPKGDLVQLHVNPTGPIMRSINTISGVYGVALEQVEDGASLGVQTDKVLVVPCEFTDTERTNKAYKTIFAVADYQGTTPTSNDVGTKCAVYLKPTDTELVTNGAFDDDSWWTTAGGWSITGGVATHTGGGSDLLKGPVGCTPQTNYLLTYTVSGRTAGTITPSIGGTSYSTRSTNATFTEAKRASTNNTELRFLAAGGFDGSIDNVSLRELGGWYIDISDTSSEDVEVVDVDTVRGEFLVQFQDSVIQS